MTADLTYSQYKDLMKKLAPALHMKRQKGSGRHRRHRGGAALPFVPPSPYTKPQYKTLPFMLKI